MKRNDGFLDFLGIVRNSSVTKKCTFFLTNIQDLSIICTFRRMYIYLDIFVVELYHTYIFNTYHR